MEISGADAAAWVNCCRRDSETALSSASQWVSLAEQPEEEEVPEAMALPLEGLPFGPTVPV